MNTINEKLLYLQYITGVAGGDAGWAPHGIQLWRDSHTSALGADGSSLCCEVMKLNDIYFVIVKLFLNIL